MYSNNKEIRMHENNSTTATTINALYRPKFETIVSQVDKATFPHGHHHNHRYGNEAYELSLVGAQAMAAHGKKSKTTSPEEPIADELTHKVHTRFIAVIDIAYSVSMLIFQLGILIGKSSTKQNTDGNPNNRPDKENGKVESSVAVLVWIAMFSIYIIQLVAAGAMFGGTNERDGRKCLRNCRIWCVTSLFLSLVLAIEICGIVISNEFELLLFPLIVFTSELSFRLIALIVVSRFIRELNFELADSGNDINDVHYQQLCPATSPLSQHKNLPGNSHSHSHSTSTSSSSHNTAAHPHYNNSQHQHHSPSHHQQRPQRHQHDSDHQRKHNVHHHQEHKQHAV